ncbi:MAG: hypothetical protein JRI46_05370 [Deltaproteobacteria bacterium]|nr:hypothetical protein [Deltaproteobacteria bacterium]
MKRLSVLLMFMILAFACVTTPTLKDYPAKGSDEKGIIQLLLNLENALNSYDPKGVLRAYASDAKVWTSDYDARWSLRMFTKDELETHIAKIAPRIEKAMLKYKYLKPRNIYIQGNQACMMVPYEIVSTSPDSNYREKGIHYFELVKINQDWFISKSIWETTDCNYSNWQELQRSNRNNKNIYEIVDCFSPKCRE